MSRTIPLTRGYVAIVDDEDYEELSRWKWNAHAQQDGIIYARRSVHVPNKTRKSRSVCIGITMHRQVLRLPVGDKRRGDHIDGNTLDNRKQNLRIATVRQNAWNHRTPVNSTSGVCGVYWNKRERRWVAQIKAPDKNIYLGQRKNFDDAVALRREAEEKYFGEYVRRAQ